MEHQNTLPQATSMEESLPEFRRRFKTYLKCGLDAFGLKDQ